MQEKIDNAKRILGKAKDPEYVQYSNYSGMTFDPNKAADWLRTHASSRSQHLCAKYVRSAIGMGLDGDVDLKGRPTRAKDYRQYLPTIGFSEINAGNYTPQTGDIIVYEKPGHPDAAGHIAMYAGDGWYSDFRQKSAFVYKNLDKSKVKIYRHNSIANTPISTSQVSTPKPPVKQDSTQQGTKSYYDDYQKRRQNFQFSYADQDFYNDLDWDPYKELFNT